MERTLAAPVRMPRLRTSMRIEALGTYVPAGRITNDELSRHVETDDAWIVRRTGIRERRRAGADEYTSDLCVAAVEDMLTRNVTLERVDAIIVATISPDYGFPSVAARVQDRLGLRKVGAVDLTAACAGFAYALDYADALITTGRARDVLVIAGETLTKIIDYTDRATCILFGDGAGAALVSGAGADHGGVLSRRVNCDGASGKHLFLTGIRTEIDDIIEPERVMRQNGRAVYEWAVTNVSGGIVELLRDAELTPADVDWFVPHSANIRMIESICARTGIPMERTLTSVEWHGNTSSASIPLALAPAIDDGRVKRGDRVLLYGFGGGLVEAGMLMRW